MVDNRKWKDEKKTEKKRHTNKQAYKILTKTREREWFIVQQRGYRNPNNTSSRNINHRHLFHHFIVNMFSRSHTNTCGLDAICLQHIWFSFFVKIQSQ